MSIRANDLIDEVATLLGDSSKGFFTQALLLSWLNRGLKHVNNYTHGIQRPAYRAKVADQFEYELPADFLKAQIVLVLDGARFYRLEPMPSLDIYADRYLITQGDPSVYDVQGNSRATRSTGTAQSGSATTLVDANKDFTVAPNLVKVGDLVLNTTDDSEATVTTVAQTTLTFSDGLAGGSDNTFAASDTYNIVSADASLQTLLIHPAFSAADTVGTESIKILYSAKHRVITQANIDNANDNLEIGEELEDSLMFRMKFLARDYEGDTAEANREYQLFQSEFKDASTAVKRRVAQFQSSWARMFNFRLVIPQTSGTARTLPAWFGSY